MSDLEGVHLVMTDFADLGPREAGDLTGICLQVAIRLMLKYRFSEGEILSRFMGELERQSPRREN